MKKTKKNEPSSPILDSSIRPPPILQQNARTPRKEGKKCCGWCPDVEIVVDPASSQSVCFNLQF
jgi:hypothetical protein